jgi:hypothetical protein
LEVSVNIWEFWNACIGGTKSKPESEKTWEQNTGENGVKKVVA